MFLFLRSKPKIKGKLKMEKIGFGVKRVFFTITITVLPSLLSLLLLRNPRNNKTLFSHPFRFYNYPAAPFFILPSLFPLISSLLFTRSASPSRLSRYYDKHLKFATYSYMELRGCSLIS